MHKVCQVKKPQNNRPMAPWLKSMHDLKAILDERKDLAAALQTSIRTAGIPEGQNIEAFYALLHRMLTDIPTVRGMNQDLEHFHYLTSSSPDNVLYEDEEF